MVLHVIFHKKISIDFECGEVSSNQEEATKLEEELKFLEECLEMPCFDEFFKEFRTMNIEDSWTMQKMKRSMKFSCIGVHKRQNFIIYLSYR